MTADTAREHIRALIAELKPYHIGRGVRDCAACDALAAAQAYLNTPELPVQPVEGGGDGGAPGSISRDRRRASQVERLIADRNEERNQRWALETELAGLRSQLATAKMLSEKYEEDRAQLRKDLNQAERQLAKQSEDMADIRDKIVTAFDLGFAWQSQLHGQNIEDSRAVGRTLLSDMFTDAGLEINVRGWDSFTTADLAICEGKRRIKAALIDPKSGEG